MSFAEIEKSGCNVFKGLVQIRYDLFWDGNDPEYKLTEVPIIPPDGYTGEETQEDYQDWLSSLPTELINPPFCSHFVYFEPTVTDEEILFVGELALDMAEKNYRAGDITKNKNMKFEWTPAWAEESARRLDAIQALDVATVNNAEIYRVK
jgi:hypothetical protein